MLQQTLKVQAIDNLEAGGADKEEGKWQKAASKDTRGASGSIGRGRLIGSKKMRFT